MTDRMPILFSRQASHGEGKTPRSGRWRPDNGRRWDVMEHLSMDYMIIMGYIQWYIMIIMII